jgi:hypothetical protein
MDRLNIPFINFYFLSLTQRLDCSEAALQLAENTTYIFLYRGNTGVIREQGKMSFRSREHRLYIECAILGEGRKLEAPLPLYLLA